MANYSTGPRRNNLTTAKNHAANIRSRGADKRSTLGGGTGIKAPEAMNAKGLRSNIMKGVKTGATKVRTPKTASKVNGPKSALAIAGDKSNANSFTQRVIKAIKNVRGNANNNGGNYG